MQTRATDIRRRVGFMTSTDINSAIRVHGPALLAYATWLTGGDRHLGEDVAQETWLRVWTHSERLHEDFGSVRGWLRRIAHNVAVDQHRRRRARPTEINLTEPRVHNTAVTPDHADAVHNRIDVGTMLKTLSPAHRTTLAEVYFADRTSTMAGSTLGIPAGTVKSRVHIALNSLRDRFDIQQAA